MFADGVADVLAETYMERTEDATIGSYPSQLRQVLLQESSNSAGGTAVVVLETQTGPPRDLGTIAFQAVQTVQKRLGVSQGVSMAILAGLSVLTPLAMALLFGMIVGGISKRNMAQLFKKRYGENYSVDATLKPDDDDKPLLDDEEDDADDDDGEGDDADKKS
jgi:hypothetical protein